MSKVVLAAVCCIALAASSAATQAARPGLIEVGDAVVQRTNRGWVLSVNIGLRYAPSRPESLCAVTVRSGTGPAHVLALRGDHLRQKVTTWVVDSGRAAVAVAFLEFARVRYPELGHVTVSVVHGARCDVPSRLAQLGRTVAVSRQRPVVLGPPVGRGLWVVGSSLDWTSASTANVDWVDGRPIIARRFAIGFRKIDALGESSPLFPDPSIGLPAPRSLFEPRPVGPNAMASYYTVGEPVLAVQHGTVREVIDGVADIFAFCGRRDVDPARRMGNGVDLDVASGVRVSYRRMMRHSIRVRVGQRVKKGDTLGLIGNSGASCIPHLALEVSPGGVSRQVGGGRPFVLEQFIEVAEADPPLSLSDGNLLFRPAARTWVRTLPVNHTVLLFP